MLIGAKFSNFQCLQMRSRANHSDSLASREREGDSGGLPGRVDMCSNTGYYTYQIGVVTLATARQNVALPHLVGAHI